MTFRTIDAPSTMMLMILADGAIARRYFENLKKRKRRNFYRCDSKHYVEWDYNSGKVRMKKNVKREKDYWGNFQVAR